MRQFMAPTDCPSHPYTVSSPEWNIFSPYVQCLEEINDDDICDWLGSVLSVWSRVYAVAKVVVVAFMHYGVDVRVRNPREFFFFFVCWQMTDEMALFISWITTQTAS
jgi:hypothetical protein